MAVSGMRWTRLRSRLQNREEMPVAVAEQLDEGRDIGRSQRRQKRDFGRLALYKCQGEQLCEPSSEGGEGGAGDWSENLASYPCLKFSTGALGGGRGGVAVVVLPSCATVCNPWKEPHPPPQFQHLLSALCCARACL